MRFPINGENVEMSLSAEVDEEGRPIWRSIWLNELIKLQHATAEAERNGQDADWYRWASIRFIGGMSVSCAANFLLTYYEFDS